MEWCLIKSRDYFTFTFYSPPRSIQNRITILKCNFNFSYKYLVHLCFFSYYLFTKKSNGQLMFDCLICDYSNLKYWILYLQSKIQFSYREYTEKLNISKPYFMCGGKDTCIYEYTNNIQLNTKYTFINEINKYIL